MKVRSLVILSCLMGVALLLSSCSGGILGAKPKYTVATDATWYPFEFVDENTKAITGFDIDLMKAIADKEGIQVEFKNVAWEALLAGIAQCQYDVAISSISITEERKPNMLFSDPYYTIGQQVVVAVDNTTIKSKDDLSGKKVGAQISTTGAIEVGKISGAELVNFDTIGLAFQALMNGSVDAVVADNALVMGYVNKYSDKLKTAGDPFTGESIGIAVCKTKPDLLKKINDGLAKVKAENLIDTLNTKWVKNQTLP
jgi:polar amino acid transport system substrate-binding protein